MWRPNPNAIPSSFALLLAFAAAILSFYLLTFSGRFHAIDEISIVATTESLVKQGEVAVEQLRWSERWTPVQNQEGVNGRYYPKRGAGPALVPAPLFALALQLPGVGLVQASMLAGALLTAWSVALLAAITLRLGYGRAVALALAAIYAFATPAWPYSRTLYDAVPTTLLWLLALWASLGPARDGAAGAVTHRPLWRLLAGAALGASVLVKASNVVAVLAFLPLLLPPIDRRAHRLALPFLAPLLFFALLIAGQNWLLFGSPLASGYGEEGRQFIFDYGASLPALLLSPGRGLLVYAPPLLATLFGVRAFWQRYRAVSRLILLLALLNLLLYGAWHMWWGGWGWGPRFLVPLVPFLLLPLAELLARPSHFRRFLLAGTGLAGVAINLLGALVDFNDYLALLARQGISDLVTIWAPAFWPPAGHLALLRAGQLDVAWFPSLLWPPLLLLLLALLALVLLLALVRGRLSSAVGLSVGLALSALSLLVTLAALPRLNGGEQEVALRELSQTIATSGGQDDVVLVDLVPYQDYFAFIKQWMNHYKAPFPYTALVRGEAEERLLERLAGHRRLWLLLPGTAPGDPASHTERWWVARAAFLDEQWSGAVRVVRFARLPARMEARPGGELGGQVRLQEPAVALSDGLLFVTLPWLPLQPLDREYRLFVQLLDQAGQVVALHDRAPRSGFLPTIAWVPGEVVEEHYALPLPPSGAPYRLIVGLYDPATGDRLSTGAGSDFIDLGTITP